MHHKALARRPINRIGHVLSRLANIWHYYPEHSLRALVTEVTLYANQVDSDLPLTSVAEIEDVPYPEGHLLHELRHLEMGIDAIEEERANEPLPPVPIQTALLGKVGEHWRKHPQMRLGQLLWGKPNI